MTPELEALGRRAVACKGFRWMPGMADCWGGRVREGDGLDRSSAFPDLTDPATLGCLLALVREAWGDPHASVWYDDEFWQSGHRWSWFAKKQTCVGYGTEAEALVAALEAVLEATP